MSRRIAFTEELCTNCHLCALSCSLVFSKGGVYEYRPTIARIRVTENEDATRYVAHVCLQCEQPTCQEACPVEAIKKEPLTGIVTVDEDKCTGCGECVAACTYDCVYLVDDLAVKCEVCDDPLCVRACAVQALTLVDDDDVHEQGRLYQEVRL